MNTSRLFVCLRLALPISLLITSGCTSTKKQRELEAVARDWCQVVRASQVLPVYPLTEDIQPGDVFLVTRPIGQEARLYQGKGFLPFEQHLVRLQPLDYPTFYGKSYGIGDNTNTPRHWQFPHESVDNRPKVPPPAQPTAQPAGQPAPAGGQPAPAPAPAPAAPPNPGDKQPTRHRADTAWTNAPRAAFPSYSFKVKSGSGLKLALPVQGVPVGLNFLQAGDASGSITISDAYTYGVSLAELTRRVQLWSKQTDQIEIFKPMQEKAARPLYVRVVSRVYLTGSVVVSLQSEEATGAEGSAGKSQEVKLLEGGDKGAVTNYLSILELLNQKMDASLPGGTVKFAQASSRAVTMNEVFDRPLVIGYLAFDFPIMPDGSLGAPVSTLERLDRGRPPEVKLGVFTPEQEAHHQLTSAVACESAEHKQSIYDTAAQTLGADFLALYKAAREKGAPADRAFSIAETKWKLTDLKNEARVQQALRAAWEQHLKTLNP